MRVGNLNFKQIKFPISGLLHSLPASWCPYIIVCTYLNISKLSAPIILSHALDVVEWHLSIFSVHFALWSEFRLMIRKREMLCVVPGRTTYRFLIFGFSPHAHTNIGIGEDIQAIDWLSWWWYLVDMAVSSMLSSAILHCPTIHSACNFHVAGHVFLNAIVTPECFRSPI